MALLAPNPHLHLGIRDPREQVPQYWPQEGPRTKTLAGGAGKTHAWQL